MPLTAEDSGEGAGDFTDGVDADDFMEIVKHDGGLSRVPFERRTLDLCIVAVQHHESALTSVPKVFWPDIHLFFDEMVREDGMSLQYVPDYLQTTRRYFLAVAQNREALQFVPKAILKRQAFDGDEAKHSEMPATYFAVKMALEWNDPSMIILGLDAIDLRSALEQMMCRNNLLHAMVAMERARTSLKLVRRYPSGSERKRTEEARLEALVAIIKMVVNAPYTPQFCTHRRHRKCTCGKGCPPFRGQSTFCRCGNVARWDHTCKTCLQSDPEECAFDGCSNTGRCGDDGLRHCKQHARDYSRIGDGSGPCTYGACGIIGDRGAHDYCWEVSRA